MPSVLVVDDEVQVRSVLRAVLEHAGYSVVEGRTGQEALQQYRSTQPDLVIIDILMPDKDGLESIMGLRQEFPHAKILAMTGGNATPGSLDFLSVATMLGAQGTLQKPFDLEGLIKTVETLLKG